MEVRRVQEEGCKFILAGQLHCSALAKSIRGSRHKGCVFPSFTQGWVGLGFYSMCLTLH
jgi:hypothetical protein